MSLVYNLEVAKKPHPKDYQKVLGSLANRPEKHLIETVMLRSLKQAQYIEENDGHFGLAVYSLYPFYVANSTLP